MASSTRRTNLHERSAALITEQKIRYQSCVSWRAGAKIEIKKTVVVDITEVCSHCRHAAVQSRLLRHIRKLAISDIAVELHRIALSCQPKIRPYPLSVCKVIAGH